MDWPTNPSPSQSLAMRRIGNEYANRAFAFGDGGQSAVRPRPLSAPMSPMQAQFAAGPNSVGAMPRPRPLSTPMSPMQSAWAGGPPAPQRVPTPNVPMVGGAPRYVSQGGALMPAINGAGRALGAVGRMAMGPVGLAAQGLVSAGMEGWERGAPQAGQDAYTYDQMGGITGLAPDVPTPQPAYSNEGRNYPASQFDDHGHMTPEHPMAKQAMERPKVVAKQRQAAMERMMPYKDTRGAGMTMTGNANGIREYEAPIDMSSIGVSAADPMDEGAYPMDEGAYL